MKRLKTDVVHLSVHRIDYTFVIRYSIEICTEKRTFDQLVRKSYNLRSVKKIDMIAGQRTYNEIISFSGKMPEGDKSFLDPYIEAIASNIRMAVLDKQCNIIWVNEQFCSLTKYSREELIAHRVSRRHLVLLHQEDYRMIYSVISKGNEWTGELKSQAKDGTLFWVKVNILPIMNRAREISSFLILASNITATKDAMAEKNLALEHLKRSQARYRVLVEKQPDIISLCQADGTRIYVNSSYCKFIGIESSALIGTNACELSLKGLPGSFKKEGLGLTVQNPETSGLFELENSAGKRFWMSLCLKGIFDAHGRLYEILTIGRNVTDLKNAELQKTAYIEDLERIAFMTSHNVRGPIATMLGLVELLRMNAIHSEQWDQVMDSFKKCIKDLDGYTRELGAFIDQRQSSG